VERAETDQQRADGGAIEAEQERHRAGARRLEHRSPKDPSGGAREGRQRRGRGVPVVGGGGFMAVRVRSGRAVVRVVLGEEGGGEKEEARRGGGEDEGGVEGRGPHKAKEPAVVAVPDRVADVAAVVVIPRHAPVGDPAVVRARRAQMDASGAEAVGETALLLEVEGLACGEIGQDMGRYREI